MTLDRRMLLGSAIAGAALLARAQSEPTSEEERERRLHEDWGYLARYRDANARLIAEGQAPACVFMGDSITELWAAARPEFFAGGRVCRGIGGQTTQQMLVRFREDVVELRPACVHIMAGTNDIAGNTGPMTPEMTQANVRSMAELAQVNGLRVILASVPPAARFPWRPGLDTVAPIHALNLWLEAYAAEIGAAYADYHAVMSDGAGGMRPGLAIDEVHPTAHGYAAMEPVALAAIAAAGALPRRVLRRE